MLTNDFIWHIESLVNQPILKTSSVSGGDISAAYRLSSKNSNLFLKINASAEAVHMFQAESQGLQNIAQTNTIATPEVLLCDSFGDRAFLLLEYVATKTPSKEDYQMLGEQLASLHIASSDYFGYQQDNYIGALHQSNKKHTSWLNFYIEERLQPQLHLAQKKKLLTPDDVPNSEKLQKVLAPYFEAVKPSLLHGDLWGGNYLIAANATPYLIDPAVYFGHHEVDIAMSKLFGGFTNEFYDTYHEHIPKTNGFEKRVQIYQLYYLLVHLNMFGRSYYSSVKRILTDLF